MASNFPLQRAGARVADRPVRHICSAAARRCCSGRPPVKSTLLPGLILLLLAAPPPAESQPAAKLWRIGWLSAFAASEEASWREAFRQGLQDHGFTEGQNVVVESRWAEGQYDRLAGFAADLVRQRVDVIVAATTTPAQAAKKSTATIPIVFLIIADPVAQGLVTSLARPGGNATGLASTAARCSSER